MTKRMHSLLDDPLIQVRDVDGNLWQLSLPEIFESLVADDVAAFAALQPHQQQPWFSFLVQVAAMATARSDRRQPPQDAATWRTLLVELSDGSEDAWHLVVEDVSKPAFMQPPVPEGSLEEAKYKADILTPDELDMLITNKTHDIKMRRITSPRPEHWLFAMLTLQTQEGFLGRGNYGIVRMNGGFGNRPFVGLSPTLTWGARFSRDVSVLVDHRPTIVDAHDLDDTGHGLLWIPAWDGGKNSGIALRTCDPYFIEICRRLRFTSDAQKELICWRCNTKGQRIDAPDDLNGRTGDPWTPIDKGDAKALTLGAAGFTYEMLQDIWLSGDYDRPPTLEFQRSDPEQAYIIATTLARGQGKTQGLHRRVISVPEDVVDLFTGPASEQKMLAQRSQNRVALAAKVQSQVLKGPTLTLVYGGRSPLEPDWDKINPWIEGFDKAVDDHFFDNLWESIRLGLSDDEAAIQWQHVLRDLAKKQYQKIRDSIPLPSIHRYRVLSTADGQFYSRLGSVLEQTINEHPAPNKEEFHDHNLSA